MRLLGTLLAFGMPQILPADAPEQDPQAQAPAGQIIPADQVEETLPDNFIPAEHAEESHPDGFIPADAVESVRPESEYLEGLTRKQLAQKAYDDQQAGIDDISKYRDAYRKKVATGYLLDSNTVDGEGSEGTLSKYWNAASAAAKTMYQGLVTQMHEASRATGIDWEKSKFTGPDSNIVTLPKEEAYKAYENVAAGVKLQAFRSADMIRTFTERVATQVLGRPLGPLAHPGPLDTESPHSVIRYMADQQFDNDVASLNVQEGLRQGVQTSGKTFETDPQTVETVSNSPLSDPTLLVPGAKGFTATRGAFGTLEKAAGTTIDRTILAGAGKIVAKPFEAAAQVARAASKTLDGSPLLSGLAAAGIAAAAGGSADTEILAALIGSHKTSFGLVNRVTDGVANSLSSTAQKLAGQLPPGPIGRFAVAAYGAVAPEFRGAVAGQLANTPFLLGAGDEDSFRQTLAGGLIAHAGGRVAGATVNGLDITSNLWKARRTAPEIRMPTKDYGVDVALDEAHRKTTDSLSNTSNNFVQSIRDYFGKDRGELYTVPHEDYVSTLDRFAQEGQIDTETANLAKQQAGVTLNLKDENGKSRPVALVPVSDGLPGLSIGHEAGHLLERLLSDEERKFVQQETLRYYGPEHVEEYRKRYNDLVDRTQSTLPKLGENDQASALSEIFAEHAAAVLNSVPIARFSEGSGNRTYARTVYSMAARALEKIGVKRPQLVEGGGTLTGTGIEPSARLGHLVENLVTAHRLDKRIVGQVGDLGAPPKESANGSAKPAPAAEANTTGNSNEIANARPAVPKPQPIGFKKGDPIGEIRNAEGVLIAEDAKVLKPSQEGQVEVEFTHPDTGERLVGSVSEDLLQSRVTPGKPNPNVVPTHPHPITPETPFGVANSPEAVVEPRQGTLPVPNQTENTVRPEAEKAPAAKPNVRVTPTQQDQFAAKASPELARKNLATVQSAVAKPRAEIPAFETDYYSAKSDVGHPDAAVRAEQRRLSDAAEAEAEQTGKPNPLKALYQKVFVPYRLVGGEKPRVFGFSLDKLIQNSDIVKAWLNEKGQDSTYLSSDKFREDLQAYLENQSHGYGGAGQKLVRPADTRPGTVTPEDPGYTPKPLSPEAAQTINLLMGFELPGKRTPAQAFHERFARLNGLDPLLLESGVAEVNPMRQKYREAGFDLRLLNGAVENLPVDRFTTPLKERNDLKFSAGDTAFSQAGFMPRPQGNSETRTVAEDYAKSAGIKNFEPHSRYAPIDEARAKKIADFYNEAKHTPDAPEVQKAYTALADETMQQYRAMQDAGVAIEPWEGKGEPYHNSREMMEDVRDNKHLWFFKTDNGFGESTESKGNALLEDSGVTINGQKLLKNDIFRAVHDYFGHTAEGYEFGPRGEYNAYLAHSRMFSEAAKPALAAETLAQNSWVNFGPHLRRSDGSLPKVGDPDFVPIAQRKFADQKNTVVPQSLLNEVDTASRAAYMPAPPTGWVLPNGEYEGFSGLQNNGDWHAGHLGLNADKYKKKFGYSAPKAGDERLAALGKGFVRVRYDGKTGRMGVEADAKMFVGKVRAKVEDVIEDNINRIDRLDVNLFDSKGKVVRQNGDSIFRLKDFEKSQAAIDILRGKSVREVPQYMPAPRPEDKWEVGYRSYNYNPPRSASLHDLVQYEGTELGNADILSAAEASAKRYGINLEKIPATDAVWVTRTEEQAQAYGDDVRKVPVKGWVPIVDLGEEGSLLVNPKHLPDSASFMPAPEAKDPRETRSYREIAAHLTDTEKAKMRSDVAQDLIDLSKDLPADVDFEHAVALGEAKKGWYSRAASTLRTIFGPDTEKFVSLLAATSPRQSVEANLVMSLEAWKKWTDAGRPQDTAQLREMFSKHVELEARLNNVIRAFTGKDLIDSPIAPPKKLNPGTELSGFKVESFRRNLLGDLLHSTNDAWMASFSGIDQKVFGTKAGYLAFTAKIRRVAKKTGLQPAEVQETVWSFFKTLVESTKVDKPAKQALAEMSEKDILTTPEFHDLLVQDPEIISLLERVGFPKDKLASLVDPAIAGKRNSAATGSLAARLVQEGRGSERVLARFAARAQQIKNAELAAARTAPPAPVPATGPVEF